MTNSPQDFDLDAWLDGAERPARSVTVYQRAGLIADLDALEARILSADDEDVDGPSMGGGANKLRAEYAQLAQQFHDSALTIRIEGRDTTERLAIASAVKDEALRGAAVLADAIQSPKFTPEQVVRLAERIGGPQFQLIADRFTEASEAIPVVSADFLPKSSTREDTGE